MTHLEHLMHAAAADTRCRRAGASRSDRRSVLATLAAAGTYGLALLASPSYGQNVTQKASAEQRLKALGIKLPAPPEPFGAYVEAVQAGNLLFLSGMLPTEGHSAKFIGRVGAELDVEAGRKAAHLAALNVLAVARQHLGSLDKVKRVVRLGVSVATSGDVREQPKVTDAASELWQDVFGKSKSPCRLVYGVASLPLGTPVELEVIFEVAA